MALSFIQPGRETIACTSTVRSGVRCGALDSPIVNHGVGSHNTLVPRTTRPLRLLLSNRAAESAASTLIARRVGSLLASLAVNWMLALVMIAPAGTGTWKRRPTI